jgi:hypothetical protein
MTATLYIEKLFLGAQYKTYPAYQMVNHVGGGRIQTVNTIHLVGLAGPHTSQPDLTLGYKVSNKVKYFSYNYFVTGENNKAFFSIPGNIPTSSHLRHLASSTMPDLKALLCVHIVVFKALNTVSFVSEGIIDMERNL